MNLFQLYHDLYSEYGPQGWWPINTTYYKEDYSEKNENEKFEIAVGAILTQNTTWINVEKVLKNLRDNQLLNKQNMQSIDIQDLALFIKSSGYYNQKARKLKELCFLSGDIRDFLFSFDVISSKLETTAPLCPGVVGFLLIKLNIKHLQIYLWFVRFVFLLKLF